MVFTDFLQTAQVFPTNFTSTILSVNIYIYMQKVVFGLVKGKTTKVLPIYIMVRPNEPFSHVTFIIYDIYNHDTGIFEN